VHEVLEVLEVQIPEMHRTHLTHHRFLRRQVPRPPAAKGLQEPPDGPRSNLTGPRDVVPVEVSVMQTEKSGTKLWLWLVVAAVAVAVIVGLIVIYHGGGSGGGPY
jgi:hypothetical protein